MPTVITRLVILAQIIFAAGPSTAATPSWHSSIDDADCAKFWKTGLSHCDKHPDTYVVIRKELRSLAWCEQGKLVQSFRTGLGFEPVGDKEREGDGKTPHGVFYITKRLPQSQFYKAFLFSYPTQEDANRGLANNLISHAQHKSILAAQASCKEPPQQTQLGGLLEIHGFGGKRDWTLGCIAIDNKQIDQLWQTLKVSDTVIVLP